MTSNSMIPSLKVHQGVEFKGSSDFLTLIFFLFWPASTGLSIGIPGIVIIGLVLFLLLLYKRKHVTSGGHFQSSNSYSDSSSHARRESGSAYFGVPLFSYEELKKATNNFDHTKELGDGGFGTVYYGMLLEHYPIN